jgi:hypothetical protein
MKIGILTLPFNNNYGGYLQAFALLNVLKDLNHEPVMIMRRHNKRHVTLSFRVKFLLKRIFKSIIKCKYFSLLYTEEVTFKELGENMISFLNTYIVPQTKYIYSSEELRCYCFGRFDGYIVGSDQVWRATYGPNISDYFLGFTEEWDVKRFSYAASFGTDTPEYTDSEVLDCAKLIQNFDDISVRERSGIDVIKNFGWRSKNIKVVLDPTLLLPKSVYNNLIEFIPVRNNFIFQYVLDESIESKKIIQNIQSQLSLSLSSIDNIQKTAKPLPSIEYWLSQFRDANFIVTDSFHGTVFSIIYNKPFIVLVNEGRGSSRFDNLLTLFELEDRKVTNVDKAIEVLAKDINWTRVNERLNVLKTQSLNFLNNI